ncbi:MAG: zinc transport system substrate-binding protein [Frankiaceae bacterium]|nr:zinc transport system substrate-binding protein [Frankiaceae bacterium]
MTAVALGAAVSTSGCAAARPRKPGTLRVEAAFYPLAFLVERIGGAAVDVHDLTPSGAEPHDLELKASQVGAVRDADLVVYLKGFQPALDAAVGRDNALDLTTVVPFQDGDPHVWLDPVLMTALADAVTARLAALVPAQATAIEGRGRALDANLHAVDREYRTRLKSCARRDIVTSHAAFGYLARRYGLTQVGIAGLSPDQEPTAKRLAEVARIVRERHVTTVFFETLVSPRLAETVARESGARTAVLHPAESDTGAGDYLAMMSANLGALAAALGCT